MPLEIYPSRTNAVRRKWIYLLLGFLFFSTGLFAHTIELRAKVNGDGSVTFYARTYHGGYELPSGGFIVDGTTYNFQGYIPATSLPEGTLLISDCPNYPKSSSDNFQYVTVSEFNTCGTHTFNCTSNAPETPICNLSTSGNLTGPSISGQPMFQNGSGCLGGTGTLSITATGNDLTYQWQLDSGNGFVDLVNDGTYSGVNSSSLKIAVVTNDMNGFTYRCVVTGLDNCNNAATTISKNAVLYPMINLTKNPQSVNLCGDYYTVFSAEATGYNIAYQWQISTDSGASWTNIDGEVNPDYYIWGLSAANSGNQYRVMVSGSCSTPATSEVAKLTYHQAPQISRQPVSLQLCEGNFANLSVAAAGDSLAYHWQASVDYGDSWMGIDGADSSAYSFKAAVTNEYILYRAEITDSTGCATNSDYVTVAVSPTTILLTGAMDAITVKRNSWMTIDSTIEVKETSTISGARITISGNFRAGDQLRTITTLPDGITQSYDSERGVLTLDGNLSPAQLQDIFRSAQIAIGGADSIQRRVAFTLGTAIPAPNGHFYEFVPGNFTWTDAKTDAQGKSYYGIQGYLATITSQSESDYIAQKLTADGWVGGTDAFAAINAATGTETYADQNASESNWYWVTGPEAGQKISAGEYWRDYGAPVAEPGMFANWAGGEPNNYGDSEDYMQIYFGNQARWNDLPNVELPGYVIEYGGMASDPCMTLSFEKTILVDTRPEILVIADQSLCARDEVGVTTTLRNVNFSEEGNVLTVSSSNPAVLPEGSMVFEDQTDSTKTLSLTPQSSGTALVTVAITTPAGDTTSTSFYLTALGPNKPVITKQDKKLLTTTSGTSYTWFMNSSLAAFNNTDGTLMPALNGFYQVQVKDANGCVSLKSDPVYYQSTLATVSPNPAISTVTLRFNNNENVSNYLVKVYDSKGRMVREISPNENHQRIDLSNLSNGIYYFWIVPKGSQKNTKDQAIKIIKLGQ